MTGKDLLMLSEQYLKNVKTMGKFSNREVERAIRDAIIAEEEAVKQYETIVDSTKNKRVKKILQDISNEEKIHVGELQALLEELSKEERGFMNDGRKEVKDI